ncbi:MAG TPA: hypothetical protein VG297_06130 [Bryobacteraceae bacterium]|nr:hypothetical protein [Bryobacteraceae bacterium]
MQCPYCQSDDITRSRRKLWERFVLAALRAQVYRCRDCRKRHWVGVEWGAVILGSLVVVVAVGIVGAVIVAHRNQKVIEAAPRVIAPRPRRIRPLQPLPPGLPPHARVPAPADK